uniref:Uncharacterized protein n=1 Tax=Haptolina brevifila TaxID=156173 RepID=A0A7S2DVJ3_9EUKA
MEGIQGFNLTYNDGPAHVSTTPGEEYQLPSTIESEEARRAQAARDAASLFRHTAARRMARHAGKLDHSAVLLAAANRKDHSALRAKDAQPLRVPYRVVLKQRVSQAP